MIDHESARGIDMVHVPFRGSPKAVLALLANEIQVLPLGLGGALSHLQQGKLYGACDGYRKAPAVTAQHADHDRIGFPRIRRCQLVGHGSACWDARRGRAGALRAASAALQEPKVVSRFAAMGLVRPVGTTQEFAAGLKKQADLWKETIARRSKLQCRKSVY